MVVNFEPKDILSYDKPLPKYITLFVCVYFICLKAVSILFSQYIIGITHSYFTGKT